MVVSDLPRPPFDPELAATLALVIDDLPVVTPDRIPEIRAMELAPDLTEQPLIEAGFLVRDLTVSGYDGVELSASVVTGPDHVRGGPGILHLHGGGMVAGQRMIGLNQISRWIAAHDAVAVTVDYRLAPEFPDPYPIEDCYATLVWMVEHADELGFDRSQLIVVGVSAGGGLAAGVALLARDRGGPRLAGQVLMCPMLDDRDDSISTLQYEDVGTWTRRSNRAAWGLLLGTRRGGGDVSIYAAPARAMDLSGLPPAYVECGSAEVFRDEGVAYASALWRAGVQAELHVWQGAYHGFDMIAPHTAVAQQAVAARSGWIARLWDQ